MKDQVASLHREGLTAIEIVNEDNNNQTAVVRGDFQYIFSTPEILLTNKNWVNVFQSSSFLERLVGVIIDEAHCVQNWGIKFRKEYAKLGELRGFFSRVCMMALTATASTSSRKEIIKLLGMKKPHLIIRCPNKPNIIYYVEEKTQDIEIVFKPLVEEVKVKGTRMDKVIIFCWTCNDCSAIYYYFKDLLKEIITDPQGYPNVPKFLIVDMFPACNSDLVKNKILSSFSSATGRLRIVLATVAFGMGIDCPNIRHVIHWSPPSNCQSYIQETGRAGRDGMTAYATLFYSRKDVSLPRAQS
uniref:DNA 3'-5' helicase n=1 Tax=Amphimedon queenslandica TaxID=400682 RepID=A0A1X7V0T4_AMPQE